MTAASSLPPMSGASPRPGGAGGPTARSTINESISITLNEPVGSSSISPSGRDIALGARKGLYIVDLDDPWATPRFLPHAASSVADVQWSPHPARSQWVVSTSGSKGLVFNLAKNDGGNPIEHVLLGHERSITDMNWAVFQVDTIATCGIDGWILVYDLRQGGNKRAQEYCGWRYGATQVKYNRQNPHELASSHGNEVYIWDDRKGSMPVTTIKAHEQKIYGIDYSRKVKDSIVTCSLDRTVKYWHLDGSPVITEPEQTIVTSSPVWRARHTPFGDGIVTLPQRSDYSVSIWGRSSPSAPVFSLEGHTDVVREFLWRTKGGDDPLDDDRVFQLVTWGSDRQLLLTPIPQNVTSAIGHIPHSPIEVRHLRRHAENRSYRDLLPSPSALGASGSGSLPPPASAAAIGISPRGGHGHPGSSSGSDAAYLSTSASAGIYQTSPTTHFSPGYGGNSKMTPPGVSLQAHSQHFGYPANTSARHNHLSSRYGRSANSASSSGSRHHSPSLGSSPVDAKGLYLANHRSRGGPSVSGQAFSGSLQAAPVGSLNRAHAGTSASVGAAGGGAYMTRAAGRGAGGQDAVTWMEGVRVVSANAQNQASQPPASQGLDHLQLPSGESNDAGLIRPGMLERKVSNYGEQASTTGGERDRLPLHEELTAIARAFENRVRFEKIAVPSRLLIVALYGPWATSGLSTFMRVTFTFPSSYPASSLNLEIERSNSISNKARAKLLSAVRGVAFRYAEKNRNSLEACLTCLLGGKVIEPDELFQDEQDGQYPHQQHLLMVKGLGEGDSEGEGSDDEDIERLIRNRNCPLPRRAGAVFSPSGQLFTFFPLDPVTSHHAHTHQNMQEKRQRSRSPTIERSERKHRRRLFESFGVIPSLQTQKNQQHQHQQLYNQTNTGYPDPLAESEVMPNEDEEDSDEVLNLPSLMMTRRRHSRGRTESIGTSHHIAPRTGRAFNSRISVQDFSALIGVDVSLSSSYLLRGSVNNMTTYNARLVDKLYAHSENQHLQACWLVQQTWQSFRALVQANGSYLHLPLIIGERLPEMMMLEILSVFMALGDIQMLGVLSCLIELDRRVIQSPKPVKTPKSSRTLGNSSAQDYFSIKPVRSRTSTADVSSSHNTFSPTPGGIAMPAGSGLPLKSPTNWLISSSVGTQASSGGSSAGRGSSWANNLSTFFKSGSGNKEEQSHSLSRDRDTPYSTAGSKPTTPSSLSPAFTRRTAVAPLTQSRKAGGIASGRPAQKQRTATHVSFAAPTVAATETGKTPKPARSAGKIMVRQLNAPEPSHAKSVLLSSYLQAQLECHRLVYADLLHRLQLPQQRAQVLKLTRSAIDKSNRTIIHLASGIEEDPASKRGTQPHLALAFACSGCGASLNGRSPTYCNHCRVHRKAMPCALCHMPLGGLTETCLACLHCCHLQCLQEWRKEETACPASCGCECTYSGGDPTSGSNDPEDFRSPPFIV